MKKEYTYYQICDTELQMCFANTFDTLEGAKACIENSFLLKGRKAHIEKVTRIIETVDTV